MEQNLRDGQLGGGASDPPPPGYGPARPMHHGDIIFHVYVTHGGGVSA